MRTQTAVRLVIVGAIVLPKVKQTIKVVLDERDKRAAIDADKDLRLDAIAMAGVVMEDLIRKGYYDPSTGRQLDLFNDQEFYRNTFEQAMRDRRGQGDNTNGGLAATWKDYPMKLPFLHENNVIRVGDLEVDDWFRLGGETYRITFIATNNFGQSVIHFVPYDHRGPQLLDVQLLILDPDVFFKAYSQRPQTNVGLHRLAQSISTIGYHRKPLR